MEVLIIENNPELTLSYRARRQLCRTNIGEWCPSSPKARKSQIKAMIRVGEREGTVVILTYDVLTPNSMIPSPRLRDSDVGHRRGGSGARLCHPLINTLS